MTSASETTQQARSTGDTPLVVPDGLDSLDRVMDVLAQWAKAGWIRSLDLALARFLLTEVPSAPPLVVLSAALASHQLGRGHSCLDLAATLEDPAFALGIPAGESGRDAAVPMTPADLLAGLTPVRWSAGLQCPQLVGAGPGDTPLVQAGERRLYLRRYWEGERDIRASIDRMLRRSADLRAGVQVERVRALLDLLFPAAEHPERTRWQHLACALAAGSAFTVITGGPGTGKTTTVVRVLALLQALEIGEVPSNAPAEGLRICLAAPTGKAAARLSAAVGSAVGKLAIDLIANAQAIRDAIPTKAVTLHRLLGSRPGTRAFRHNTRNPLPYDVLVVDESSMVDLEMMAATLNAMRKSARVILLGDKDQLASVEAGTVLGVLCQRAAEAHYTQETVTWLERCTAQPVEAQYRDDGGSALDQAVVMLRWSHRFGQDSGIGRLAQAVNDGQEARLDAILDSAPPDLRVADLAGPRGADFRLLVIDGAASGEPAAGQGGYRQYLTAIQSGMPDANCTDRAAFDRWAEASLKAFGRFQVLCAVRAGPWGVESLNERIAAELLSAGMIPESQGWYLGRPVMVTRNDYDLGLMNGDVGMTLRLPRLAGPGPDPAAVGVQTDLRVAFTGEDGKIKWVAPSRLQDVETVYALTVHKSQGSEFAHVALVLPDAIGPILTRELVYTGITRASEKLTLAGVAVKSVVAQAMRRRVLRSSGLGEAD